MHHWWLVFISNPVTSCWFLFFTNVTSLSSLSFPMFPIHTQFFFVAYDCVCEGWVEVEMTTEDVYLRDHTASQDAIRKWRRQTDWWSDGLRVSVLRIVGKHLHLLNCTGGQFNLLKCTGKVVHCAEMYGEAVWFVETYGKAVWFAQM
jgi:hypothetical protein